MKSIRVKPQSWRRRRFDLPLARRAPFRAARPRPGTTKLTGLESATLDTFRPAPDFARELTAAPMSDGLTSRDDQLIGCQRPARMLLFDSHGESMNATARKTAEQGVGVPRTRMARKEQGDEGTTTANRRNSAG